MNNELCHYGVKGMKWGVRRYDETPLRRLLLGKSNTYDRRYKYMVSNLQNTKAHREAIKQKRIDRDEYEAKTSTGKLLAQNLLLSHNVAENYRNARARGNTRGQAFAEGYLGLILGNRRDIKKYGDIGVVSKSRFKWDLPKEKKK